MRASEKITIALAVIAYMTSHRRLDRARGALLGTFVGDALGMPFEGSPPSSIPAHVDHAATG